MRNDSFYHLLRWGKQATTSALGCLASACSLHFTSDVVQMNVCIQTLHCIYTSTRYWIWKTPNSVFKHTKCISQINNYINISSKVSKGDHLNGHSFLVSFQLAACNKIIISENPKSNRLNLKFSDPSSKTVNLIRSCYVWFTFSGLPCLLQVLLTSHLRFLCVSSTHLDKNTNPNFPERRTNRKRNGIIIPWERSIWMWVSLMGLGPFSYWPEELEYSL